MKKFFKERGNTPIFAFFIFVLALSLRLYNLTNLPIFADEAIYVRWAQVMRAEETLRFLPLSDGKQPLFMWSLIPFLKLFSDPLFAGRLVSVICGIASIIGVFLAARLLFKSEKVGLIASLIVGISPFVVFFDRMALVDSMLAMFAVWTFYLGVVTAKSLRLDMAMLTGFALGGAFLTKSPALFFAILLPTTIVFVDWPKNFREKVLTFLRYVFLIGVALVIALGLANILRLGPNFHLLSSRNYDYVYPFSHVLRSFTNPLFAHLNASLNYLWLLAPGSLLVLAVLGAILSIRKRRKEIILISLWIALPLFAICEYGKVFTARYMVFVLPFFAVLAASGFLLKNNLLKKGLLFLLIIFVLQSLSINRLLLTDIESVRLPRSERSGYLEEWTAGTGINEIAQLVREEYFKEPDKKIVVGTEGYFGTLPDGLQIYLNDLPQITVIGIGLGVDRVPKPLYESRLAGNKTYLVINNTRFLGNAEKLGLDTLAAYPKAVKPDGARETLLFYQLSERSIQIPTKK